MEEGERSRRRRPEDEDGRGGGEGEGEEEAVVGEAFFRLSLAILAAVVLAVSFVPPPPAGAAGGYGGGGGRDCPGGAVCVVPDSSALLLPPGDGGGIVGTAMELAREDPPFVGVGNVSRVFTCGIAAWLGPAVELLFPEYCPDRLYMVNAIKCRPERIVNRARSLGLPLEDSLVVVRPTIEGEGFLNESFPGKVLYVNTENGAYPIPPSHYGLGPYLDTNHTLRLYLASLYLNTLDDGLKSLILDSSDSSSSSDSDDSPATAVRRPRNNRRNFALFVASGHCSDLRLNFVVRLSAIGTVHVAGRCVRRLRKLCRTPSWGCRVGRNERIVPVNVTDRGFDRRSPDVAALRNQSFWSLHDFYGQYRFAMVFENRRLGGYVTEKIVNAFLGGSVPIYYGTRDVFEVFNRRAMVYFDEEDPRKAIDLIASLMKNETAYDEVLNQPILANGTETVRDVFSLNETHGDGRLKHRIRKMVLGV